MRKMFARTLLAVAAAAAALALATAPALAASGQSPLATQTGQSSGPPIPTAANCSAACLAALQGQTSPVPPPPLEQGCYAYSSGWVSQPCLSSATVLSEGPPPTFPPGIEIPPPGPNGPSGALNGSDVLDLSVNDGSGTEYDTVPPGPGVIASNYGPGGYSVQNNTNVFTGNNGAKDWVQFVFQNFINSNHTCIWQINVTLATATGNAQGYDPTGCYTMSAGPEVVWGAAFSTRPIGSLAGANYLVIQTMTVSGEIQASVQPDIYGLGTDGNWTAASGGILGAGSGSEAIFSPGWVEDNGVTVTDCSPILVAPCVAGPLPAGTEEFPSAVTEESSNLVPTSTPTVKWGTGHHSAYITYQSTVPGG